MNGCMCGCRDQRPGAAGWPAREDRIGRLEDYQRDLEQRMTEIADEIRRLKEDSRPAS